MQEIPDFIKQNLALKKQEYSYDWLGRSLAYNNYPPRDILSCIHEDENIKKIYQITKFDIENLSSYCKENMDFVSLGKADEILELDLLTILRRYIKIPIIRNDLIFDEYQILEAAVFGADSLVLKAKVLSKNDLKSLIKFSQRLRICPIIEIENKIDLTKAIICGADILSFDAKQNLAHLIPKNKIIIATNYENQSGFDAYFTKEM